MKIIIGLICNSDWNNPETRIPMMKAKVNFIKG